jgi:hypothetical protein
MEPTQTKIDANALRVRVVLGKFQVKKLDRGSNGFKMTVDMTNGVSMRCDVPFIADVQLGDYLTFYTEILADLAKTPITTGTQ